MNKLTITIIAILLLATVMSLKIQHNQYNIVGGWSTGDVNNADKQIDQFIRTQFPELKDAKLTQVQTQVVAGINYKYSYDNNGTTWRITVWDQSWTKLRQVTAIEKVENKINSSGQNVQVTTNTRIETRTFTQVARDYFNPQPATTSTTTPTPSTN